VSDLKRFYPFNFFYYVNECFRSRSAWRCKILFFFFVTKTDLVVSVLVVVSVLSVVWMKIQNTEKNQKRFFGFAKQTENQPKYIEFQFVLVRTKNFVCLFVLWNPGF
jgi:hypothetical protein